MNINYFKEFATLAETRNYWEASERLFLSQSTLSKHIQSMESELGVPLFTRTTRKVELTEYGSALLPYAQSIMRLQFDYSAMLLQKKNRSKNLLSIGSIPVMAQYGITPLLLDFQNSCPDCKLKVTEEDPKNLKQLLFDQTCELIFLRESCHGTDDPFETDDGLVHIPYLTDYLVALLPTGHPLAGQPELSLRSLMEEKFCFLKESSMLYDLCRSACQAAGFIPDIVFDSHRLDSIFDMVTYGNCVAMLMNRHVESRLCSASPAPFADVKIVPAISTQISLCYQKNALLSRSAQQFLSYFEANRKCL
ncbi:MAG: LysR family transcriptional regulator [Eubacteriales bacterium]|nr:LysR family transcriptional regulator [Eubacteriales bacterium]